jgi:hypothetical protein
MFTKRLFYLWIVFVLPIVTACATSTQSNPADHFAGTWSGTMSFTDDANRKEDIIIISQPVAAGEAYAAISITQLCIAPGK